jgi:hypothetical protein
MGTVIAETTARNEWMDYGGLSERRASESFACLSPPRLLLEVGVGERVPVGVADDEAGVGLIN